MEYNFVAIDLTSTPINGKYRQNFNRFDFPTGTIKSNMEVCRDRFVAVELPPYKEVMFEEATEEWYAQRDLVEVDWVECNCIPQAGQFAHIMEENDSLPMYSFNHPQVWQRI